jgi:hypothetical protein
MSARVQSARAWGLVLLALLVILISDSCDDEDGDGSPVAVPAYRFGLVRTER